MIQSKPRVCCVVVAAGRGQRAGFGFNKLFQKIKGRSALSICLDSLKKSELIDDIILVLSKDDMSAWEEIEKTEGKNPLIRQIVEGGETRLESSYNGLCALPTDTEIALIHDGARPFVSREIIENTISDAREFGSGVICTEVTDTVKLINDDSFAYGTTDRAKLRAVQTPQAFLYKKIMQAYESAISVGFQATDDSAVYEREFSSVKLTRAKSAKSNFKLTTKDDFTYAESRLTKPRIGTGYDAHRLVPDRELWLCGVQVPYEKGLLGHSDADAPIHALIDALLGAAALGDIGKIFPDSDERYRGISSVKLLKAVFERISEAGFAVANVDITIVCQRPKLAKYIQTMRETLAEALLLPLERVSVKATTTEGMGFEGEGLGISAQASALLL